MFDSVRVRGVLPTLLQSVARSGEASCVVLAVAAFATPGLAQSAVRVGYSDLNLQSPAGAQVMLARLSAAAHRACGPAPAIQALGPNHEYDLCLKETLGAAVAALNVPLVTAAYGGTGATSRTVATVDAPR